MSDARGALTGFVAHPDFNRHDPGAGHPERPERLGAILARVTASGLMQELALVEPEAAVRADLELAHDPAYVERIVELSKRAASEQARVQLDADTVMGQGSLRAARLAVGGTLAAVARVASGEWHNAFVASRPPGHHAERAAAMGFCLFNQVAIAARALRERHGLERVAILDFDVHHGNGTQHAFESDPAVFYASLHQFPLYPGSGAASERGVADGEGTTLNCPQPPGAGEREWLAALETRILPALERFRPQFLLLSAGFDGHVADPIAQQRLATASYRAISDLCTAFAREQCGGRIVSVLEGGYDLAALADSAQVHVEALRAAARATPPPVSAA